MPYKRKAQVLFLAHGDPCRAALAAAIARRIAFDFIEPRAHTLAIQAPRAEVVEAMMRLGADLTVSDLVLNETALQWADFVVTLDAEADALCPRLPSSAQKRCYPFTPPSAGADLAALQQVLEMRIAGIVGGMKIIA